MLIGQRRERLFAFDNRSGDFGVVGPTMPRIMPAR